MGRTVRWILILGALLIWGLTDFVSTLRTCQQQHQQDESCGFAHSLTYRAGKTLLEWIDIRHDLVTAAATVVVAIFTATLWRATNKLWLAAKEQSRDAKEALIATQRAIISMKGFLPGVDTAPGDQNIRNFMFAPQWGKHWQHFREELQGV